MCQPLYQNFGLTINLDPQCYNLGLAESKISGRELRAIAWFVTYLSIATNAPNKAAVKDFISSLQIKSEGNISRFLGSVLEAAKQIPTRFKVGGYSKDSPLEEVQRSLAITEVARLYALSDDGKKAAEIAIEANISLNKLSNYGVIGWMIEYGGHDGISGARECLAAAVKNGRNQHYSTYVLSLIAVKEAENGDFIHASYDLEAVLKSHEVVNRPLDDLYDGDLADTLIQIAKFQAKYGENEESRRSLLKAMKLVKERYPEGEKISHYRMLAEAQARCLDVTGAQATYNAYLKNDADIFSDALKKYIAIAQGIKGDIANAKATADTIKNQNLKDDAQQAIIFNTKQSLSANSGNLTYIDNETRTRSIDYFDWITRLGINSPGDEAFLNSPLFLDLSSYIKSLPTGDPQKTFDGLLNTASKLVEMHKSIAKDVELANNHKPES